MEGITQRRLPQAQSARSRIWRWEIPLQTVFRVNPCFLVSCLAHFFHCDVRSRKRRAPAAASATVNLLLPITFITFYNLLTARIFITKLTLIITKTNTYFKSKGFMFSTSCPMFVYCYKLLHIWDWSSPKLLEDEQSFLCWRLIMKVWTLQTFCPYWGLSPSPSSFWGLMMFLHCRFNRFNPLPWRPTTNKTHQKHSASHQSQFVAQREQSWERFRPPRWRSVTAVQRHLEMSWWI